MLETRTGTILSSRKSGEADRILDVLTDSDEFLNLKYHGIRASQRRSQIAIQPGNTVQVVFYRKDVENQLFSIKELSLAKEIKLQGRYLILQRLAATLALVRASASGGPRGLYALCQGALEALETNQDADNKWFLDLIGFLVVRIQKLQGMLGDVHSCSGCGEALWQSDIWPPGSYKPSYWNEPDIDFLCEGCALRDNQLAARANTIHAFWIFAASRMKFSAFCQSLDTFPTISGPAGTPARLLQDVQHFLGPLKELQFIDSD
ncbi:MAG: hypothetical protein CMN76_02655 [Spirochaetaceae bacterium]|nr:hypothetical protein [Spirochaetaceae bacterium]|tara:strand:+ start:49783 stop:50571 length:789 start_codon:yes stop_codon:yes gene_type:complete